MTDSRSKSRPGNRVRWCRRRIGGPISALCVVAALFSASDNQPAAAAQSAQTDWHVVNPHLDGPSEYWFSCVVKNHSCSFTYASRRNETAVNCAVVDLDVRLGRQEVYALIPEAGTSTMTYRLEFRDARSGSLRRYSRKINQSLYSDEWVPLWTISNATTRSMTITVCDHEAEQDYRDHGKPSSQVAVSAFAARCVSQCSTSSQLVQLGNLTKSTVNDHVTYIEWDDPNVSHPLHAGYRVRYHKSGFGGEPVEGEPWSSRTYHSFKPRHTSPELINGGWYRVDVTAVDVFGLESPVASLWFEPGWRPPKPPLLPSTLTFWEDFAIQFTYGLREGLDWLGVVDPTPISDGLSGVISVAMSDHGAAALSFVAIIPYVGDTAKVGNKLRKAADAARKTGKNVPDIGSLKITDETKDVLRKFSDAGFERMPNALIDLKWLASSNVSVSVTFRTDELGRVVSASVDDLHELAKVPSVKRNTTIAGHVRKLGDEGDQSGHIIAFKFGGDLEVPMNLVPQASNVNQGAYRQVENYLSNMKTANTGSTMRVEWDVVYGNSNSFRPKEFQIQATIDGMDCGIITVANVAATAANVPDITTGC